MINKRTFLIAFAVCSAYFLQAQEVSKTAISTPKNEFSIGIVHSTNTIAVNILSPRYVRP